MAGPAAVGTAYVIVRAVTNRVRPDIAKAFSGINKIGDEAGDGVGQGFSRGFRRTVTNSISDGLSNAFSGIAQEGLAAKDAFQSLVRTSNVLGPAIVGLVGGLASLVNGFIALGGAVLAATPSLVVIPGILASIGIAAVAVGLAFRGVFQAIGERSKKAGGAAKGAARDLDPLKDRIKDIKQEIKELELDWPNRLADAYKKLEEATYNADRAQRSYRNAQEATEEAKKAVNRALQAQTDAQERTRRALEGLNDAREEAAERIQQLRFQLEGGVLSEKRARLEFERTRDSLQRVQDLPPNSRARQEAELAFAEAELNLRKTIDSNNDLEKANERATREGIEGSREVVAAKEEIANAAEAEKDAAEAVFQARRRVRNSIESEADAYRSLERARQALTDAEEYATQGVYQEYLSDLAELNKDLARAERDLEKAKRKTTAGAAAQSSAYDDLGAGAKEFVDFIVNEFQPALKDLGDTIGNNLFPLLTSGLRRIVDQLFPKIKPNLAALGTDIGEAFNTIIDSIVDDENIGDLQQLIDNAGINIGKIGEIVGNVYDAILSILVAAQPLIERFLDFLVEKTGEFAEFLDLSEENGTLTDFFNNAGDIAAQIGSIIGNVFGGISGIVSATTGPGSGGQLLLDNLERITGQFDKFANDEGGGQERLKNFFASSSKNAASVSGFLGEVLEAFLVLGANPAIGAFFDTLRESDIVENISEIANKFALAGPSLARFVDQILRFVDNVTQTEAITAFFDTLSLGLDKLNDFLENETVKKIMDQLAPIFGTLLAISTALSVLTFAFKVLAGFAASAVLPIAKLAGLFGFVGTSAIAGFAAAIVGAGLALYAMWQESEDFRNAIKDLIDSVLRVVREEFEKIKAVIEENEDKIDKLKAIFKFLGDVLSNTTIPILKFLLTNVIKVIGWYIRNVMIPLIGWWIDKIFDLAMWFKDRFDDIYFTVKTLVDWWQNTAWPAIKEFYENIKDGVQDFKDAVVEAWQTVQDGVDAIVEWWQTDVVDRWNEYYDEIKQSVQEAIDRVKEIWEDLKQNVSEFVDDIKESVSKTWDDLSETLEETWDTVWSYIDPENGSIATAVRDFVSSISDTVSGAWDGLVSGIQDAWAAVKRWWNANVAPRDLTIGGGTYSFLGQTVDVPKIGLDIPELAMGGVINPTSGGSLAIIGEAGRPERVEPLDPDGLSKRDKAIISMLSGGGATINVYPSEGMDEKDLADKVARQLLLQMRRGAA